MEKIRVLLADDHTVVRQGLRGFLEAEPEFSIAAETGDGLEAVRLRLAPRGYPFRRRPRRRFSRDRRISRVSTGR